MRPLSLIALIVLSAMACGGGGGSGGSGGSYQQPVCGNGILDVGEICDDGDTDPCTLECDATCTGPAPKPECGNGVVDCEEECPADDPFNKGPWCPEAREDFHVCLPCAEGDAVELRLPHSIAIFDLFSQRDWTLPPLLGGLVPDLVDSGEVQPLVLTFHDRGPGQFEVVMSFADNAHRPLTLDESITPIRIESVSDWSCNPWFELRLDALSFKAGNLPWFPLHDIQLVARFADNGGLDDVSIGALLDPRPLTEEFGLDFCILLPEVCDDNGMVPCLMNDLQAQIIGDWPAEEFEP